LDRVLEALSPALAAELDRVVSETREALEQEFQKTASIAVREAESASRQAAEAEQEQAVREARETTKNQVTEETQRAIQENARADDQRAEVGSVNGTRAGSGTARSIRIFADAQKLLGEATSQPEILARFLKMTEPFAPLLPSTLRKPTGLRFGKPAAKPHFPRSFPSKRPIPNSISRS